MYQYTYVRLSYCSVSVPSFMYCTLLYNRRKIQYRISAGAFYICILGENMKKGKGENITEKWRKRKYKGKLKITKINVNQKWGKKGSGWVNIGYSGRGLVRSFQWARVILFSDRYIRYRRSLMYSIWYVLPVRIVLPKVMLCAFNVFKNKYQYLSYGTVRITI